jgi:hypothetical protein
MRRKQTPQLADCDCGDDDDGPTREPGRIIVTAAELAARVAIETRHRGDVDRVAPDTARAARRVKRAAAEAARRKTARRKANAKRGASDGR